MIVFGGGTKSSLVAACAARTRDFGKGFMLVSVLCCSPSSFYLNAAVLWLHRTGSCCACSGCTWSTQERFRCTCSTNPANRSPPTSGRNHKHTGDGLDSFSVSPEGEAPLGFFGKDQLYYITLYSLSFMVGNRRILAALDMYLVDPCSDMPTVCLFLRRYIRMSMCKRVELCRAFQRGKGIISDTRSISCNSLRTRLLLRISRDPCVARYTGSWI